MSNHIIDSQGVNLLTLKKGQTQSVLDFKTPCNTEFELIKLFIHVIPFLGIFRDI